MSFQKKYLLNRETLKNRFNIAYVSCTGDVYKYYKRFVNGCEIIDNLEDDDDNVLYIKRIPENYRINKHPSGTDYRKPCITVYDNLTNKWITLPVSNVVYAWYHKDYDVTKQIDHIDDNTMNNAVWNLQQLTPEENNTKRLARMKAEKENSNGNK